MFVWSHENKNKNKWLEIFQPLVGNLHKLGKTLLLEFRMIERFRERMYLTVLVSEIFHIQQWIYFDN